MVVNYTYTGKTSGFFWEFDPNTHVLTLSGNGSMPDYEPEFYSIPTWMKFRGNVDEVRFDEGITRIGSNSFFSFDRGRRTLSGPHLQRVVFPSTLQAIGHSAFRGNPYLEKVELSACESLSTVEPYAFASCLHMKGADLSGCALLKAIGPHAFDDCAELAFIDLSGCASLDPEAISSLCDEVFDHTAIIAADGSLIWHGGKTLKQPGQT